MIKRTTVEIDQDLLERARRALGMRTVRATVEAALLRAADAGESEFEARADRQLQYLERLHEWGDPDVLASEEMWR